ncbi:hypothetical protein M8542_25595 [Amycolatopsis sp. OK19-0408]|uniref:Secreted protein n=1 Tax=Amycolatopsis iheyensis TaxID=2945988 RepID=A0A9X2SN32_9PSEU|nr:hypothetical protein [Amycolatopsis iheyensis]MCR6486205.1 hypothetical protein [Amycolatopsis iheyensis]
MGRTLNRVAGVVSAAALVTFAAAPVALADDETPTSTTEPTTSTSETPTSSSAPTSSTSATQTESSPVSTTGTPAPAKPKRAAAAPTTPKTTTSPSEASEPPKDDYQDNTGAGFVGLGGEGVLVINCAAGAPGNLAAQYLSVTGGPDQDESDGRIWNYTVRVADAPAGTTTAKFSWTCAGVEGNGTVEFEQEQPPTTSTSSSPTTTSAPASSTAPVTTATTTTSTTAPGNAAPKAQVKVTPKGTVETGFGGMAW